MKITIFFYQFSYPKIVLVVPPWKEVSRERRRSIAQNVEHRTRNAFFQDEEAKQKFLSPYWTPRKERVQVEEKNEDERICR